MDYNKISLKASEMPSAPAADQRRRFRKIWEEKPTCTRVEAAAVIPVHPRTIRRYIKKGFLRTTQNGSRVLTDSIREFLGQ
jgi:hypothetical protein